MTRSTRPSLGAIAFFAIAFALSAYFTFAAVQGDFGLFRRVEIQAEAEELQQDLSRLQSRISEMENLTRRLSDDYLDLDLLDEQARTVLGLVRADEIVIR
ncbi:septum formation initiator family protein [Leisingera sp. JC11]|uniref:FtsB family cell division protein n=1 Tax=Leisingera sp. JC11 TaxID=3042469 RepID=UPI003451E69C